MQKYVIFGKYNQVVITNSLPKGIKDCEYVVIEYSKEWLKASDISSFLKQKTEAKDIILLSRDEEPKKIFEALTKQFFFVKAAGGIVENEDKEILFIYRNKTWDLPKGHVENDETDEQAAVREVAEETGLTSLQIKSFAGFTYHTYYMNNRWELKQTAWYFMKGSKQSTLTPQQEEAIEQVKWIKSSEINTILQQSYASIRELFERLPQK